MHFLKTTFIYVQCLHNNVVAQITNSTYFSLWSNWSESSKFFWDISFLTVILKFSENNKTNSLVVQNYCASCTLQKTFISVHQICPKKPVPACNKKINFYIQGRYLGSTRQYYVFPTSCYTWNFQDLTPPPKKNTKKKQWPSFFKLTDW